MPIPVGMRTLDDFSGASREQLIRHLATSARWHLGVENGTLVATRRFVSDGRWQGSLNGYVTSSSFDTWSEDRFQYRILVAPDGPVMDKPWSKILTRAAVRSDTVRLRAIDDTESGQGIESYLVLESDAGAVEIFEQSQHRSRACTPIALEQIAAELQSVRDSRVAATRGFDPSLLPEASVGDGQPRIELICGMQGGIYQVYAYVNPGESGYAVLRVFEATRGTALSAERIAPRSIEYTGWSSNPAEVFFYHTEITVYEGDWGTYYPARFVLCFVPASGAPERTLVERVFRIEGWQR